MVGVCRVSGQASAMQSEVLQIGNRPGRLAINAVFPTISGLTKSPADRSAKRIGELRSSEFMAIEAAQFRIEIAF
jgi:hypothetical protein